MVDRYDQTVSDAMRAGAQQDPWELRQALELVAGLDPLRVVVEIGCDRGGTLLAWRSVCEQVYGITAEGNTPESGGQGLPLAAYGAVVRFGDSHDPASLAWLRSMLTDDFTETQAPVDVLVIDGDHYAEGVRQDLADYGPLVRPGGLILMHDITWTFSPETVQVCQVWPRLADRFDTAEIRNPLGRVQGWGVIRVRPGDQFGGV